MAHRKHNEIAEYHAEQVASRDPRLTKAPASYDAAEAAWAEQERAWDLLERQAADEERAYLDWWHETHGHQDDYDAACDEGWGW